jgi:hypothetical protein
MPQRSVACLNLKPLAFYGHPPDDALIAIEGGRVVAFSDHLPECGITIGMKSAAARLKAPQALLLETNSPELDVLWLDLLETFAAASLEVESLGAGEALMVLSEDEAWDLALLYRAAIGLAPTRALARVGASLARAGEVVIVAERLSFLDACPVGALSILGFSERILEHLALLGLRFVGELSAWSDKQLIAYFGAQHRIVLELLRGTDARVARYRPRVTITETLEFEDALCEPRDLEPAVSELAQGLYRQLNNRSAARLVLAAHTPLGVLRETSIGKLEVHDARMLARAIWRVLQRSRASALGVTRLEVRLEGFASRGELVNLFARPSLDLAVRRVNRRYPGQVQRYREVNTYAEALDLRFALEVWHAPNAIQG